MFEQVRFAIKATFEYTDNLQSASHLACFRPFDRSKISAISGHTKRREMIGGRAKSSLTQTNLPRHSKQLVD